MNTNHKKETHLVQLHCCQTPLNLVSGEHTVATRVITWVESGKTYTILSTAEREHNWVILGVVRY